MLQLLFPSLAELFDDLRTPPLIIVGSRLLKDKILATRDVVVVFPWDPTTTIFFVNEVMCPSISPLL